MKTVIFAEKPKQAMEYAKALGIKERKNGYIVLKDSEIIKNAVVTWAIGHLVELKKPQDYQDPINTWNVENLPFFPPQYEYAVSKSKQQQFKIVKDILKNSETIINSTDYAREGSNIFYATLKLCGVKNKKIKRYANSSLVHKEIRKNFKNLEDNTKDLRMYEEANTRQISDYLVGMNLSPYYTNIFRSKGISDTFSIGRVQTPTLYLIYERHKEIENFVSEPFYEIKGVFNSESGKYEGKAKIKTKDKKEVENIFNEYSLKNSKIGTVKNLETKEKKQKSPKLFSLSSLQMKANQLYKLSSKETLTIAQSLYDKKILTYPRTDTAAITKSEFNYLLSMLDDLKEFYKKDFKTIYKEERKGYVVDHIEEHHAILPTSELPSRADIDNLNKNEKNILDLVVSNTLSMFANDYIYDETKVETSVNGLMFYSTGKTEKEIGWKKLFNNNNLKDKENEETSKLPILTINEQVQSNTTIKEGHTQPPKAYTDGQLINMMMNCGKALEDTEDQRILKETQGLGTEATRSDIIQTLINREYIKIEKNRYYVTPKGEMLCTAIKGTLLSSPSMTAEWEKRLNEIGKGNASKDQFLNMIQKFIEKELSLRNEKENNAEIKDLAKTIKSENIIASCPNCKEGEIEKRGKVYKCNSCTQIFFSNFFKKKLTDNQIKEIIKNGKTKKKIKLYKKDGKSTYEAFLILKDNKEKEIKEYAISFE